MASGAGIAGFGGGFGQGLASVLISRREQEREDEQRKEAEKFREFQTLFPIRFQMFQENPTPEAATALEEWTVGHIPSLKKELKAKGFTFQALAPMFQGQSQPTKVTEMNEAGLPREVEGQPTLPMTSGAAVMTPPKPTFFGSPVLTVEERAEQAANVQDVGNRAQIESRIRIARQLGLGPAEARDYALYGTRPPASSVGQTTEYEDFLSAWAADKGKDPAKLTSADRIAARKEWTAAGSSAQAGQGTEFAQFYADWLESKGKTEETGTAADRVAARREWMGAGRSQDITPGQQATLTRQLRQDRVRETAAASNAIRQLHDMRLAMADVRAKRRVGGDQAIISMFNKMIDPGSVTMVSEYGRSAAGIAFADRFRESINRVFYGGSGVTAEGLAELVALAEGFTQGQVGHANEISAEVEAIASEYGINPKLVGREFALPGTEPPAKPNTAPPATAPAVIDLNTPVFIGPDGRPSLTPPGAR